MSKITLRADWAKRRGQGLHNERICSRRRPKPCGTACHEKARRGGCVARAGEFGGVVERLYCRTPRARPGASWGPCRAFRANGAGMRKKPVRICSYPSCRTRTRERYCEAHARLVIGQTRRHVLSSAQRGYGARHRADREWYRRLHYTCERCGEPVFGKNADLHHVESIADRPDLQHDPGNWQILCRQCHARADAERRRGRGG